MASSIVFIPRYWRIPWLSQELWQSSKSKVLPLSRYEVSTTSRPGPAIEAACDDAWAHSSSIVFDLAGATFIDSTVFRATASARRRAAESGGSVAVVAPAGGSACARLTLVGINDVLPLHETRDEALRTISAPG